MNPFAIVLFIIALVLIWVFMSLHFEKIGDDIESILKYIKSIFKGDEENE